MNEVVFKLEDKSIASFPIPDGYRVNGFGKPSKGYYLHHNSMKVVQYNASAPPSGPRFLLEKIPVLRVIKVTDCKPGEKVIVKDSRGDIYYLLGWMGQSAVVHYPAGADKYNTFTYNPDCLFIEE